jgi:hypothetical protein
MLVPFVKCSMWRRGTSVPRIKILILELNIQKAAGHVTEGA